ncbi:SpvB/TcaC N-terminal domain-containing protein [Leptolyngbya sp. FACHB-711]|uniref:SpvB/TcaC N-terminal domain-containing protein n=1 Tax=Leptolyngbya sp. FACHB-711 TaxID=2692813 RepID=UPI001682F33E|nr:SpvB/TcaC N-terminal domain-containing protein [Leptolyngbya sp. FACHB-711]MBD2026809.1 VCBS repeat-containing protein [Leptolyngbya sp. FACHB-711]
MLGNADRSSEQSAEPNKSYFSPPSTVSLPKAGGAIKGIGEKFAANPVTGTGSLSIPIASSVGRSEFNPQLSLSYDSGSGNGAFGFGWSLSLPSITRKTDQGLPRYEDAIESDVFILSGAEDLVPVYQRDDQGNWVRDPQGKLIIEQDDIDGYQVRRYRPRTEGLFARIEQWSKIDRPEDVHWRSISKDNILTLYGKDTNSRIADPEVTGRIFSWLICETRDDKGNAILYEYKPEDGAGADLHATHERNRGDRDDQRRTANRYLKRIYYGNRVPLLDSTGYRPRFLSDLPADQTNNPYWMFELVFDYGEHDTQMPTPGDAGEWHYRNDPFSNYRAGFEVRTARLCQRVLMFHHFEGEAEVGKDCLVRSTDFAYSRQQNPEETDQPVYSFMLSVTQSGYKWQGNGYFKRSLPPLEFEYTQPQVQNRVEEVDPTSLENLPIGLDGSTYQWIDLHAEGIPGILTEQATGWFYKRNISPIGKHPVEFAPIEQVVSKPNLALGAGQAQFMDLAGDGQPDLVVMNGAVVGLYEHDDREGWQPFRSFPSRLKCSMADANLKFVDLDGDGHADVLITEDSAFVWHQSLAEEGFGVAQRVAQALDEETGPRLAFADGSQSIYLADLSGDGLTDLVRIRNGEVCYWSNLGYGRFGAKVSMDNAPYFDHPDQFDPKRIRLADIDGTGTTDILYLHRDGMRIYFNQSGNCWSMPQSLPVFPQVDNLTSIVPTDLLGNGTACLVWSSPLPADQRRQMRYVNLMGGQKPHLLIKTINNFGAETRIHYVSSTQFYLQDKYSGKPWITRLPFPVQVVERVETYDHVSRNRFVTRYAYHHGYFDGVEREFRGFGMVEQWDTEEFSALGENGAADATNLDAAAHLPPVHTKTWYHTGLYLDREHISRQFEAEYYREPGLSNEVFRRLLLPDTVLPDHLTLDEEREACRALKGLMLRQEVYADDAPPEASEAIVQRAKTPYTVIEQSFTIRTLQPRAEQRYGVFFAHPREAITYHYERNPADPRIQHAMTLEVDDFGNTLQEIAVAYGRRQPDPTLPLPIDRDQQTQRLITYTQNRFTHAIGDAAPSHHYRTPLPCESHTYELTGFVPENFAPENHADRFSFDEWTRKDFALLASAVEIQYEQTADRTTRQKRLIEQVRTLYRKDDLTAFLETGQLEPRALPGESYKLAFTPGLLSQVFQRPLNATRPPGTASENLLPDPAAVLRGTEGDRGGYVDLDNSGHWWIPSGQVFYSPDSADTAAQELAHARQHFFLPHRYRDPFGGITTVKYDRAPAAAAPPYNLLTVETIDPLGNRVTIGERDENGNLTSHGNDYRVLQPRLLTDPNRNRTAVAFDALGMVVGTAVMGKPLPDAAEGDSLAGFEADLTQGQINAFYEAADPHSTALPLLKDATTRVIYDLERFQRTQEAHPSDPAQWLPIYAASVARETHLNASLPPDGLKVQVGFSYSDGFGREIQKKIQAEPEKTNGVVGALRWVGSGWTIFNNKGKPVRQYEPFFSQLPPAQRHHFEFAQIVGVSPILFYDPLERVIATLYPNHTYEKVIFDPWKQVTYDVNDTVAPQGTETGDPRTDRHIQGYVSRYFATQPETWQTWYAQRQGAALGAQEQAAATKAAAHANTPTIAYFDTLGRPFLTVAHNRVVSQNHTLNGTEAQFYSRIERDIEGNQRSVRDAIVQAGDPQGRLVMRYHYDLLGNQIHQASMEAGKRWILNNVAGNPIRIWDSRGHRFRTEYDRLRRPLRSFVTGADSANPALEMLTERLVYGEQHPENESRNLRGQLYLHLEQAGAAANEAYDFKGNLLRSSRRLVKEYKKSIAWSAADAALPASSTAKIDRVALEAVLAPLLEAETFASHTVFDALNRPIQAIAPRSSQAGANRNIIQPKYNEANLLERIDIWLSHPEEPIGLIDRAAVPPSPVGVENIDYDAKGQRLQIDYKNGVTTRYTYDPETFRLIQLYTRRGTAFTEDCGNQPPRFAAPDNPPQNTPCGLQNLRYTYDPAGNIVHIRDDAQQTIFFRGKQVEPSAAFTYDALYRLIEATGREHLGQVGGAPIPHTYSDIPRVAIDWSASDGNAMGTYLERYVYDAVGNFLEMQHRGSDPEHSGWTRSFAYREVSLLEPGKQSNRLTSTTIGERTETYSTDGNGYDAHGNMLRMPQLQIMQWDYKDQLQMTQRQKVDDDDINGVARQGERTYYVYDASGQRSRKITELANGNLKDERIYLGSFEIYRQHSGNHAGLVRESLHVMNDKQHIALVETRNEIDDRTEKQLIRYQLSNHLSSASLELDDRAQIIFYEEYTPYGSTSYQAVRSQTETPKRYRYTGKERDEESGLYYHGARYYAPWLGRWTRSDPVDIKDGLNVYAFVRANPVRFIDPQGTQAHPAEEMSPEVRAAWEAAERANYDEASVRALVEAQDRDFERRGLPLATRQALLERATVRATTSVRQWEQGNYGTAIVQGGAGVIESLGIGSGMLGDSLKGTATRMVAFAVAPAVVRRGFAGISRFFSGRGTTPAAPPPTPTPPPPVPATPPPAPASPAVPPRPTGPSVPQGQGTGGSAQGVPLPAAPAGLRFGANDLVYGASARGALRRLQESAGGRLLNDVAGKTPDQSWIQFSIQTMEAQIAQGGRIRFDLTNMENLQGILQNTGQHAGTITAQELRYLQANWARFQGNVTFYRNGVEVPAPW